VNNFFTEGKRMKKIWILLLIVTALSASAQNGDELANERAYQFQLQSIQAQNEEIQEELAAEAANAEKGAAIRRRAQAIASTLQNYPWRAVDGITQHVAVSWCIFSGKVLQTTADGVRVDGEYASMYPDGAVSFVGEFFVKHFPYRLAEGDNLPPYVAGMPVAVYTYTTVMGGERAIHCLDFGVLCDEPAWAIKADAKAEDEARARAASVAAARAKGEARALGINEAAAAKGDLYGLLRMGERYRDGDGVAKDLAKARMYLLQAQYGGNLTASNELASLPQAPTVSTNSETAQSR
jgi:TPR repeat protein